MIGRYQPTSFPLSWVLLFVINENALNLKGRKHQYNVRIKNFFFFQLRNLWIDKKKLCRVKDIAIVAVVRYHHSESNSFNPKWLLNLFIDQIWKSWYNLHTSPSFPRFIQHYNIPQIVETIVPRPTCKFYIKKVKALLSHSNKILKINWQFATII